MSETFEKISQALDEDVEFAAATSFIACHVDESCGQDGPPAGDVEVLAFLDPQGDAMDAESGALFAAKYPNYTALVDRAHITRLQAVNAALQARLTVADQNVDDLQSELTKAIGLVRWFYTHANVHQVGTVMMDAAREFIAHQSAPAAMGGA